MVFRYITPHDELEGIETSVLLMNYFVYSLDIKRRTEEKAGFFATKESSDEYYKSLEDFKDKIEEELLNRKFYCPQCEEITFSEFSEKYSPSLRCPVCEDSYLIKMPDFQIGDVVKIIGYNSIDDLEEMELESDLIEFLLKSELVAFKIANIDSNDNQVKIEGYDCWIDAEIFEKIS